MRLTKHHGLGNDFLVAFHPGVDDLPALARRLCDRRRGVVAVEVARDREPRPACRVGGETLLGVEGRNAPGQHDDGGALVARGARRDVGRDGPRDAGQALRPRLAAARSARAEQHQARSAAGAGASRSATSSW